MDATFRKYPDLQEYLMRFSERVTGNIDTQSIVVFGGIALDDFSRKYSDIDIAVVLKSGLSEQEHRAIKRVVTELTKSDPVYTRLLYTYFIPGFMLESPSSKFDSQDGLIYGNEKWRSMKQYPLSTTDDFSIRENGEVLFGVDLRKRFPTPPKDCFWKMFIDSLPYIEASVEKHPFQHGEDHNDNTTVNLLLYFPRLLYSLVEEDMIGKSASAFWFQEEYDGPLGEFLVELAKCRQESSSVHNDDSLVLSSRRLILFTLERILEIQGADANLSDLVDIDRFKVNFHPVVEEFRNSIRRKMGAEYSI